LSQQERKSVEIKEVYRMSDLQQEILKLICENRDLDYDTIQEKTEKKHDESAILRSVHTLEQKKMIMRSKAEPNNPRSRLLFRPTDKGAFTAIIHLGSSYQKCFSIYYQETLSQLNSAFKDELLREKVLLGQIKYSIESGRFDDNGKFIPLKDEEQEWSVIDTRLAVDTMMKLLMERISRSTIRDLPNIYGRDMMLQTKRHYEKIDNKIHQVLDEFKKMGY
jgi:predicted transcriptional regulator